MDKKPQAWFLNAKAIIMAFDTLSIAIIMAFAFISHNYGLLIRSIAYTNKK